MNLHIVPDTSKMAKKQTNKQTISTDLIYTVNLLCGINAKATSGTSLNIHLSITQGKLKRLYQNFRGYKKKVLLPV